MKVAQLVTTLARGGAQLTVLEAARTHGTGIRMTVLAGPDRPDDGDFWDDERLHDVDVVEVSHLRRRIAPLHDIVAVVELTRWLRRERPDVLHTHSTKAGVVGRLAAAAAGVPVVHTVHGWAGPLYAGNRVVRNAVRLLEIGLARITNRIVVVGNGDRERGLALGIGTAATYRVVRSGIDIDGTSTTPSTGDDAERTAARAAMGVSDDRLIVGMVARFAPQKDHRTAIEAVGRLIADGHDACLICIGDGPGFEAISRFVADRRLSEHVRLLGHCDKASWLAHGFDISLLTSHWEGVPRSLVESAAAGVPLVASDVGSVADIVIDGATGFLVCEGDVDGVHKALRRLADDPDQRRRLGREAADVARSFSADQMRSDLAALWTEVAASGSKPVVS